MSAGKMETGLLEQRRILQNRFFNLSSKYDWFRCEPPVLPSNPILMNIDIQMKFQVPFARKTTEQGSSSRVPPLPVTPEGSSVLFDPEDQENAITTPLFRNLSCQKKADSAYGSPSTPYQIPTTVEHNTNHSFEHQNILGQRKENDDEGLMSGERSDAQPRVHGSEGTCMEEEERTEMEDFSIISHVRWKEEWEDDDLTDDVGKYFSCGSSVGSNVDEHELSHCLSAGGLGSRSPRDDFAECCPFSPIQQSSNDLSEEFDLDGSTLISDADTVIEEDQTSMSERASSAMYPASVYDGSSSPSSSPAEPNRVRRLRARIRRESDISIDVFDGSSHDISSPMGAVVSSAGNDLPCRAGVEKRLYDDKNGRILESSDDCSANLNITAEKIEPNIISDCIMDPSLVANPSEKTRKLHRLRVPRLDCDVSIDIFDEGSQHSSAISSQSIGLPTVKEQSSVRDETEESADHKGIDSTQAEEHSASEFTPVLRKERSAAKARMRRLQKSRKSNVSVEIFDEESNNLTASEERVTASITGGSRAEPIVLDNTLDVDRDGSCVSEHCCDSFSCEMAFSPSLVKRISTHQPACSENRRISDSNCSTLSTRDMPLRNLERAMDNLVVDVVADEESPRAMSESESLKSSPVFVVNAPCDLAAASDREMNSTVIVDSSSLETRTHMDDQGAAVGVTEAQDSIAAALPPPRPTAQRRLVSKQQLNVLDESMSDDEELNQRIEATLRESRQRHGPHKKAAHLDFMSSDDDFEDVDSDEEKTGDISEFVNRAFRTASQRKDELSRYSNLTDVEYMRKRKTIAVELKKIYNRCALKKQLQNVKIEWSGRLVSSAGTTNCRLHQGVRSAEIKLSSKILTTFERLRDTLAHEMAHAAVFIIDRNNEDNHGPLFREWAIRIQQQVPGVRGASDRCHTYDIESKYRFVCRDAACGNTYPRHKRIDTTNRKHLCKCGSELSFEEM